MLQMTMDLDHKQQRPAILLEDNLTALLDTGAFVPVWVDNENVLIEKFGAKFVKGNVPLAGFGGVTYGNMYQATFQVGALTFPNLHIIVNDELNNPFNLILSATMFQGLVYEIDDRRHKFNVTVPDGESLVRNMRIVDSSGRLHVLCESAQGGMAEADT